MIQVLVQDFFQQLYMVRHIIDNETVVSLIPRLVTYEINVVLLPPLLNDEVQKVVFNLGGTKASGPNDFLDLFYQSNQDVLGFDLCNTVYSFYSWGYLLKEELSRIYIVLIPKCANLVTLA